MFDINLLAHYFKIFKIITPLDIEHLYDATNEVQIPHADYWIKPNDNTAKIGYIKKGLMRIFYIDDNGNEITTIIRQENQFISSYDNILFDQPSRFYYQAIEPTTLIVADYNKIQQIINNNPKLEQARSYFLRKMLGESVLRIEGFVLLSPEERYKKFIAENSTLYQRIPDKYIASILGITPVSLSRIKKRISKKK